MTKNPESQDSFLEMKHEELEILHAAGWKLFFSWRRQLQNDNDAGDVHESWYAVHPATGQIKNHRLTLWQDDPQRESVVALDFLILLQEILVDKPKSAAELQQILEGLEVDTEDAI